MAEAASTDRPARQHPLAGVALRLVTAVLLAIMFALVKLAASRGVHVVESLFYRQIGSAVCATGVLLAGPGLASLQTRRVGAHVGRMMLGLVAMGLNFTAMILLPLAEATAIGFTVPIFSTILAAVMLREATGRWRWGAVLAGFVGVLLIIQPGGGGAVPIGGALVALVAAGLTAAVTIVIRRLGATEPATTTVFWFAASSLLPLGLLMLFFGRAHHDETFAILAGMALAGGLAQLTLTASLRLAPVALVMPMDYTGLLWATLLGVWLFAELPSSSVWLGAPVIIASGLVIVWREHHLARRAALAARASTPA